jgi:hypothetical protein
MKLGQRWGKQKPYPHGVCILIKREAFYITWEEWSMKMGSMVIQWPRGQGWALQDHGSGTGIQRTKRSQPTPRTPEESMCQEKGQ